MLRECKYEDIEQLRGMSIFILLSTNKKVRNKVKKNTIYEKISISYQNMTKFFARIWYCYYC